MDTFELVDKLSHSSIVKAEIPLGIQIGLPWLEMKNGKLCICFKPHREEYADECVYYYAPQFYIAWVWPFEHLVSFQRLTLDSSIDISKPISSISISRLLSVGKYGMNELYRECTKILNLQEKDNTVSEAWIRSYQKSYNNLIETLGLEKIYRQ